jgi:hypothetical protein
MRRFALTLFALNKLSESCLSKQGSGVVKVILLLLFFITPPAPGPKVESKRVWTLQSTSQIEMDNSDACHRIGNDMINYIKPVATMTVRAYCICPNGNGKTCPKDTERELSGPRPTVEPL